MLWNNHNLKILEKDDKVAVGIFILYFFRTWLNEAYIVNVSFANPASFIFTIKISSDFVFLISQGTISHILEARQDSFLVQNTWCGFFASAELNHFSDCMVSVQSAKYLS